LKELNILSILKRAKHLLVDRRTANKKQQQQNMQFGNAAVVTLQSAEQVTQQECWAYRWKKPMHARFKCNIDAFFSASTNRLGIGMCILDKEGPFVSKTMWFIPVCLVDVGEAFGLYHAIRWIIHNLWLPSVGFEVDLKRVADYFKRSNGDITKFGVIMDINNIHYCSLYLTNSIMLSLLGDKRIRLPISKDIHFFN
jgi:hypothetical protein